MPTEATQLLCNTLHLTGQGDYYPWIYKESHKNHPCSLWTSESLDNWLWLQEYVVMMGYEYTFRYEKLHKSVLLAKILPRPNIQSYGITPFAKVVPEEFSKLETVDAYRHYFIKYKQHLKQYTKRKPPDWWQ